jgi:SAM-dependent methyltransferase
MWAQGIRVLQGNRFAPTETEHLYKLISYMDLNGERTVADMGCGFGEVARAMSHIIPAVFWLVNENKFQLYHCPMIPEFTLLCEDMCQTSIMDDAVDLVMFNYSLCHLNMAALRSGRIAKPSARLFIYDYARTSGDNELAETHLFSRFITDPEFREACDETEWTDVETIFPGGDDTTFRKAMANDELYDSIFNDVVPVIWKARRTYT